MIETGWGGGLGVLLLGLVIGMQHALEADHVAAVSSIAAGQSSVRRIVAHGAVWGLGHTVTLMAVAGGAVAFGAAISDALASWLELLVGLMLIGLGARLVTALVRERVHFHRHRHADGKVHWHAHSHAGVTTPHDPHRHEHHHPRGLPVSTLLVGVMHGMAGSAALLVLTAASVASVPLGLGYVVVFGIGSVIGMAALSAVIAVPLSWSARALTWANGAAQSAIGLATIILGVLVASESLRGLAGA